MRGVIADVNIQGHVDELIRMIEADPWSIFWADLGIAYYHFADVGLEPKSLDSEIWHVCQVEKLVLITDNRNQDDDDSLESTIRSKNTPESLPVFTVANIPHLRESREYAARVIEKMLDFLERIEDLRGTGRIYLP